MHHLEIEHNENMEKVRTRAEQIKARRAEAAMEALRKREPYVTAHRKIAEEAIREADDLGRREPVFDDYNEPTHRENIRVSDMAAIDLTDTVNHPSHYTQGKIECIEVLEQLAADGHDFRILNAIKYLWRYRHKGGNESLRKAIWYIERVANDG